jgi:hypothetical protein
MIWTCSDPFFDHNAVGSGRLVRALNTREIVGCWEVRREAGPINGNSLCVDGLYKHLDKHGTPADNNDEPKNNSHVTYPTCKRALANVRNTRLTTVVLF